MVVTFVSLRVFAAIALNISSVITPQDDAVAAGSNVLVPVELVIVRDVVLAILPRLVSGISTVIVFTAPVPLAVIADPAKLSVVAVVARDTPSS